MIRVRNLIVGVFAVAVLIPSAVYAQAPGVGRDNSTPFAGLFPTLNASAVPTLVATGPTKLGALNSIGPTVFEMKNNTKAPLTSLLVAVDLGAASRTRYACSRLPAQILPTCSSAAVGTVAYFLFSGGTIAPDGTFRLGFAPSDDFTTWPPSLPVTVTAGGQIPTR